MSTSLPRPKSRVMATWKLKEQLDQGVISLEADYQRDVKWDQDKMSYLIDSIFTNYYIPPLLFAIRKIKTKNTRMVIDGKQRLSAINRFMNNEFPYVVSETEEPKFYCRGDDDDDNVERTYLTEDEIDLFNSFEFVCVEYNGITEDEEYEIFSRVQLGVAITNAEKLRAHNTPIAKTCRELVDQFGDIKSLLAKKTDDALLFQVIAYMYMTLKNGAANFHSRYNHLTHFIKSAEDPPIEHDDIVLRTLTTISSISKDTNYKETLTKRDNKACCVKTIEILVFMMYRKSVGRPRSVRDYANDFAEMRQYLHVQRNGKVNMGKDAFLTGMQFVEQRLEELNLAPIRPYVHSLGSDSDELKQEEYSEEESLSEPVTVRNQKRRRQDIRPTARRGGKFSGGLSRK